MSLRTAVPTASSGAPSTAGGRPVRQQTARDLQVRWGAGLEQLLCMGADIAKCPASRLLQGPIVLMQSADTGCNLQVPLPAHVAGCSGCRRQAPRAI